MALSNAQIRAIAIKRSIARKAQPTAANDNTPQPRQSRTSKMPAGLLADCIAAGGFSEHEGHGG